MAREKNCFFNQVFDPSSELMVQWNRFMIMVCVITFFIDPVVMYIPTFQESKTSVGLDLQLAITLAILKMIGDSFLMLGILVKFRTAYEAPGSRVFKRRRLIEEPRDIAIKNIKSTFVIDLIAALPLSEVYIWLQLQSSKATISPVSHVTSFTVLYLISWIQVYPKLYDMCFSKIEASKTAGNLLKSGMSGAFYNLLWFTGISNVLGAVYYFQNIYWIICCTDVVIQKGLEPKTLDWDQLLSNCTQDKDIEMGIFSSGLTNKIVKRNFIQRFMFCFSWGLKSFSSLGQNFTTSYYTLETSISIGVTLLGLIFFADLITRMQAGIQSMEEKEEQQRARQREVKEWMDYHQLSLDLKERVDHAIQTEWTENGIDDEAMLVSLPMDLRSEIRKYLYMDSVCKLPKFADMNSLLVEAICQLLKTFSGKEGTYIVYEGDIVKQMLFIFSGELELSFTDKGNSTLTILGPGECCGQDLVTWASQPTTSMDSLPFSTWTIKCLTDVEAFVLQAYDMKILATQFAHNQEFQRAFKQHYP